MFEIRPARGLVAWLRRFGRPERCLVVGEDGLREGAGVVQVARMTLLRMSPDNERVWAETQLRDMLRWTRADRLVIVQGALPRPEALALESAARSVGVRVGAPRRH